MLVDADLAERNRKGGPVTARTDWTAEPGPRQWLVECWLPAGRVALLSGQGGAGKSRLALQLAAAMAEKRAEWLPHGLSLAQFGPAVIATWEDEPDEITRRLRGMVEPQDRLEALKDRLHVLDFAGKGAFWQPVEGGSRHTSTLGELTLAGEWTRAYCETHKARLLVVDPLAAAYACSENDRGLVRAFMTSWDGWARATDCAVLIVSHPAKAAESDYSGSTDWHASARAVWKLGTAETGAGNGAGKAKEKAPAPRLDCLKTMRSPPFDCELPRPLFGFSPGQSAVELHDCRPLAQDVCPHIRRVMPRQGKLYVNLTQGPGRLNSRYHRPPRRVTVHFPGQAAPSLAGPQLPGRLSHPLPAPGNLDAATGQPGPSPRPRTAPFPRHPPPLQRPPRD